MISSSFWFVVILFLKNQNTNTFITIKKPGLPSAFQLRQPGCLFQSKMIETRGFPSLPHGRFGFIQ
jgi:hypothetical protein